MVSALATVRNRSGLHMRPAQVFVRSVSKFPCEVTLRVGERLFNGKSILGLMTARAWGSGRNNEKKPCGEKVSAGLFCLLGNEDQPMPPLRMPRISTSRVTPQNRYLAMG